MKCTIEAACGCDAGKIRKNNEDNFYFNGKHLDPENSGLKAPMVMKANLKDGFLAAVFDGVGGENFGEYASYAGAKGMYRRKRGFAQRLAPAENYLNELAAHLNDLVVAQQRELCTERMASTMACLYIEGNSAYSCNLGDSRVYRFREGKITRMSVDHVERRPNMEHRKAPIIQYLGIDPEEMRIEPSISKEEIQKGDIYLLCSDGLTDMVPETEIANMLSAGGPAEKCVRNLMQAAMENGGRDNITVIVCRIQ